MSFVFLHITGQKFASVSLHFHDLMHVILNNPQHKKTVYPRWDHYNSFDLVWDAVINDLQQSSGYITESRSHFVLLFLH